jgi:hypothetical protein
VRSAASQPSSRRAARVAAGLGEEGAGAHGEVADLELEDRGGRAELPLVAGEALGGAEVAEGLEGVADDRAGQLGRGVVGAGGAALGALGDVEAAGGEDDGDLVGVAAEQRGPEFDAREEGLVVVAGAEEQATLLGRGGVADGGGSLEGVGAAAGGLAEALEQGFGVGGEALEVGEGDLGVGALAAAQAEDGAGGADGGVVEEALVDVADLLDAEAVEREAAGLGEAAGERDGE